MDCPIIEVFHILLAHLELLKSIFTGIMRLIVNCQKAVGSGLTLASCNHDCGYGHEIDILEPSGAMMENAIQYGANNHGPFYDPSAINSPDHCTELADGGVVNVLPMNQAFYSYSCGMVAFKYKVLL